MLKQLKEEVWEANLELERAGLVKLTWGNVSGLDETRERMVIKPSGVPYSGLVPEQLVVMDLSGRVLEGKLKPSSDTPTHLQLYRAFPDLCGITHTHSLYATMFCQAARELPCLGTTHADHFHGTIPLARALTPAEVEDDYEAWTGKVIIECFQDRAPLEMPAVLVAHHGPFTWGRTAAESVANSIALETVAEMALGTWQLSAQVPAIPSHILDKHYTRKHGPQASYGQ